MNGPNHSDDELLYAEEIYNSGGRKSEQVWNCSDDANNAGIPQSWSKVSVL